MRTAGYVLEHGMNPDYLFSLPRQDRLIYQAMAELNQEQEMRMLTTAVHNAIVTFWNELHEEG